MEMTAYIQDTGPVSGNSSLFKESGDSILSGFSQAPVSLIKERNLLQRVDTKFIIKENVALEALSLIRKNYKLLPADGSLTATYKTLYFDTGDLDFFHDHRRGKRIRYKVRIRNYPERNLGFLEIKKRINQYHKQKFRFERIPGDYTLRSSDMKIIRDHTGIGNRLSRQIHMDFNRITLINTTVNERVTFDYGLVLTSGKTTFKIPELAIVEVKQWPFMRNSTIMSTIKSKHVRARSFSKYCIAIILTKPGVRSNRLHSQLRILKGGEK